MQSSKNGMQDRNYEKFQMGAKIIKEIIDVIYGNKNEPFEDQVESTKEECLVESDEESSTPSQLLNSKLTMQIA